MADTKASPVKIRKAIRMAVGRELHIISLLQHKHAINVLKMSKLTYVAVDGICKGDHRTAVY